MLALDWLIGWQVRALQRGRIPALTIEQLIMLRVLLEAEQTNMVAKVHGLARFVQAARLIDDDGDEMAADLEGLFARRVKSKAGFKTAIAAGHKAFDVVDQLAAALGGNGGPSEASEQSSEAPAKSETPADAQAPQAPPAAEPNGMTHTGIPNPPAPDKPADPAPAPPQAADKPPDPANP
jgi:hypothetical protein